MPVTVRFNPNVNSLQAAIIPDATPKNDGVMTAAQAALLASISPGMEISALVGLDGTVSAPNNSNISTHGSATLLVTVPAGMTKFKVTQNGPRLIANVGSPTANLLSGSMAVLDVNSLTVLVPDSTGVYTVSPGQQLGAFANVANVFNSSPVSAPANQWSIEFVYTFAA